MTNFRALCAQFVELWDADCDTDVEINELLVELRAALVEPESSLKEQALKELKDWTDEKHGPGGEVFICEGLSVSTIRRALEALPDAD